MWYKNVASMFFGLVTKHECDRRTDGRTDRRTELRLPRPGQHRAASRGKNHFFYSAQLLNTDDGSRDLTTPLSGCLTIHGLAIATDNLPTKFEVSISTHYEDMKGDTKCRKWVVWGSQRHSRSLEIAPIDRAPTSSYQRSIVTMSLFCTLCEIQPDIGRKSPF